MQGHAIKFCQANRKNGFWRKRKRLTENREIPEC